MKTRFCLPALCLILIAPPAFGQDLDARGPGMNVTTAPPSEPRDKERPNTTATLRHGRLAVEDMATMMEETSASAKAGKPWSLAIIFGLSVIYALDDAESAALVAAAFKQESDAQLAATVAASNAAVAEAIKGAAAIAAEQREITASLNALAQSSAALERQQRADDKRRRDEEYCRQHPPTPYGGAATGFMRGLHGCPAYVPPPPPAPLTCHSNQIGDTVFTNCY